jgi:hypothetical protein
MELAVVGSSPRKSRLAIHTSQSVPLSLLVNVNDPQRPNVVLTVDLLRIYGKENVEASSIDGDHSRAGKHILPLRIARESVVNVYFLTSDFIVERAGEPAGPMELKFHEEIEG